MREWVKSVSVSVSVSWEIRKIIERYYPRDVAKDYYVGDGSTVKI